MTFQYWEEDEAFRLSSSQHESGLEYRRDELVEWDYSVADSPLRRATPFTRQFLFHFRRNRWLSGASIEALATEKAEWIRGFTREELEAWGLAF